MKQMKNSMLKELVWVSWLVDCYLMKKTFEQTDNRGNRDDEWEELLKHEHNRTFNRARYESFVTLEMAEEVREVMLKLLQTMRSKK